MLDQHGVETAVAALMTVDPVSQIRLTEGHDAADVATEFLFDLVHAVSEHDQSEELDHYERSRFGFDQLPFGIHGDLLRQLIPLLQSIVRPEAVAKIATKSTCLPV